ncbi:ProQ/FinO family protein [Caballeronia sp. HLA56]
MATQHALMRNSTLTWSRLSTPRTFKLTDTVYKLVPGMHDRTMGFEQLAALKAQLSDHSEHDRDDLRRTPAAAPEVTGQDVTPSSKPPKTSAAAALRAVTKLQQHFPRAFPPSPAPKIPLKVGILKDVLAQAASIGLSERDARNGIKLWCRGQRYWSCLEEGSNRVDLAGAVTGVVSATEADYGISQEKTRLARTKDRMVKNGRRLPR